MHFKNNLLVSCSLSHMMFRENLPLFGLMVLLFALFHEAGIAMGQSQYYNAYSCGNITNISFPFRLKGAPGEYGCGDCCLELGCENNRTTLLTDSGKYYVQEIDYVNRTIRLIDTSLDRNTCSIRLIDESIDRNTCPIPRTFHSRFRRINICITFSGGYFNYVIYFMNCTLPAVNLSLHDYVDVTRCVGNSPSAQAYFYAISGDLTVSDLPTSCSIEAWVKTRFSNATGVSVSDIHQELLQAFELSYDWNDHKNKW